MFLSPSQVFGEAEHLARETPIALATRQVVPLDETGIDGLTDWGSSEAILYGFLRAEDDLGGHLYHASPFPMLDDLGIVQVRRWKELWCGLGPAFARDVQDNFRHAIHV